MENDNIYEEFYGKEVELVVNAVKGRQFTGNTSASQSYSIRGKVVNETSKLLHLSDILSYSLYTLVLEKYEKAAINKDYIIGIFEKREK